jgi:GTP:adenosylcobinamide-phosphate guanylyltransferase
MTGEKIYRNPLFTALVLAGERGEPEALTENSGAGCKALVPVGGTPMLYRVLDALSDSTEVGSILMSGPDRAQLEHSSHLTQGMTAGRWDWGQPGPSPATSAYAALQSLPEAAPVLLTTADHALLRAEVVDHFCAAARQTGCDLAVALVDHAQVVSAFPDAQRTALRFRGGAYCGCNLYAFLTPASRRVADFWSQVEQDRKRPWRIARALGWRPLLAYLTGRLSLEGKLRLLSDRLGVNICPVILPFPDAAVDVDKPSDKDLAERILATRTGAAPT